MSKKTANTSLSQLTLTPTTNGVSSASTHGENRKLRIEPIPATVWEENCRKYMKPEEWDVLRKRCYAAAWYKCEICGAEGVPIECDEIWEADTVNSKWVLVGVQALCSPCHRAKHIGRTEWESRQTGRSIDDVITHYQRVNGIGYRGYLKDRKAASEWYKRHCLYIYDTDITLGYILLHYATEKSKMADKVWLHRNDIRWMFQYFPTQFYRGMNRWLL